MEIENDLRKTLLSFANERFDRAFRHWNDVYFERMRDWDDYYNVRLPKDLENMISDDDQSSLVPPDVHFLVNDFRASILSPFQRAGRIARLRGIGPRDVQNEAFAQALLDWSIERSDYWPEFDMDIQNIACGGYAVGVTEMRPLTVRTVSKGKIVDEELFKGAKFPVYRHLDRYKTFYDPRAERAVWPQCRYLAYQQYMTREELLHEKAQDSNRWVFTTEDLDRAAGERAKSDSEFMRKFGQGNREREVSDKTEPMAVTHYVGSFYTNGNESKSEQVVISFIGQTLLGYIKPDYDVPLVDTFHLATLHPSDDRLVSMGKIEPIEDLFLEHYIKRNQRVDAVNVNAWGLNFMQRDSQVPEAHRLGPMTFIKVDDPVGIQTYTGGDTNALFTESALVKQEIRENFGSDYGLGINPNQRESATGATLLIESATKGAVMSVRNIWYTGKKREMELRMAYLQLHAPDEVYVRLSEDPKQALERVTKEQIQGMFDFSMAVGIDEFTPDSIRQARVERIAAAYRDDPDVDQRALKKQHFQANGFANAGLLVVAQDEREQLPRTETAVILRTGMQLPVNETDDDLLHYQIHMEGVKTALVLASEGKVVAANINTLLEHSNQHMDRAQARYGTQPQDRRVVGGGNGHMGQRDITENSSNEPAKISETRGRAQRTANETAGPFQ